MTDTVVTLPPGIRLDVAMVGLTNLFGHRAVLEVAAGNLHFTGTGLPREDKAKIAEAIQLLHRAVQLVGEVEVAQDE